MQDIRSHDYLTKRDWLSFSINPSVLFHGEYPFLQHGIRYYAGLESRLLYSVIHSSMVWELNEGLQRLVISDLPADSAEGALEKNKKQSPLHVPFELKNILRFIGAQACL